MRLLVPEVSNRIAGLSSAEKRALLADLLREKARAAESFYPLSYNQQGIWFLSQLALRVWFTTSASPRELPRSLDVPALRRSFQALVDRHPLSEDHLHHPLRETGATDPSGCEGPLRGVGCSLHGSLDEIESRLTDEAHRPFDLEQGPLLRVSVFKRSARETLPLVGRASHRDRFLVARDTSK